LDLEAGSINATTHVISDKYGKTLYSTADELFETKSPMERIRSAYYEELSLDFITDMSYRSASKRLNRIRWEESGVSSRTLCNIVEREGKAMEAVLETKSEAIFEAAGFTREGLPLASNHIEQPAFVPVMPDEIKACAIQLGLTNPIDPTEYESQETTVNISIDDVLTKRQVSERPDSPERGKRKYNSNTVIHVHKEDASQVLVAGTVASAMKQLIALVLSCGLAGKHSFVFFTDGASDLHNAIKRMFTFQTYKIILDWYHLVAKMEQRLSSASNGRKIRNALLDDLLPLLWKGDVEAAILYLTEIPKNSLKAPDHIVKLIDYLKKNQPYIPCYALRKELGLRNSSNRGEKANDLVVAHRQKHDGMSWSSDGSIALATVTAVCRNDQLYNWVHHRDLTFELKKSIAA
jgi:hypothetical protein